MDANFSGQDIMIFLFGENGQVAREVITAAASSQIPLKPCSSEAVNFLNPDDVRRVVDSLPEGTTIINAAAYTQVDQAENDSIAARQINALTPEVIARTCRDRGLNLIHLSTDYVFNGEKPGPYIEDDPSQPLGVYGATKREGEELILQSLPRAIILRTSWVFSAHGKNFVKTMLRLGSQRSELSVVADQHGGPTSAASIAKTCLLLAQQNAFEQGGIYHYSGAPQTTWHGFAEAIFRQARLPVTVHPIPTSDYPTPARRPTNSVLDCSRIQSVFGIAQPNWKEDLSTVLSCLQGS